MVRGGFKANPWVIVRAHWATYVDARDNRPRWQDLAAFGLPPLATLALCIWQDVQLPRGASAGLLTITGLLSVFLFGVVTQISGRAMEWADSRPIPSRATSLHATNLLELAANAAYASLLCLAAAIAFAFAAAIASHLGLRISSAIGLAISVHLVMVMLMVLRREFLLTQERLGRARTGADLDDSMAGQIRR